MFRQRTGGFIQIVLIIVLALILLGYFGYNVRDIINTPTVQDNLHYVWAGILAVWDNYLKGPAMYLWQTVMQPTWQLFLDNFNRMRQGQPNDFQKNAPSVPMS